LATGSARNLATTAASTLRARLQILNPITANLRFVFGNCRSGPSGGQGAFPELVL
jgi:hypothetical protein